jgi:hypothetical protein
VEIEASPELSNLDEAAFRPVECGVSVHQILSLTEQSMAAGEEKVTAFNDPTPIALESPGAEFERAIAAAADAQPALGDDKTGQICIQAEAEGESKNGFLVLPEGDRAVAVAAAKRGAASKSATASSASQQMCFNWS